jgi:ribonuclease R
MSEENLETIVLRHVLRENYQPVKPRVIAKQLKLDAEGVDELKRIIKRLVKRGQLAYGAKHIVHRGPAQGPRTEAVPILASEDESNPPLALLEIDSEAAAEAAPQPRPKKKPKSAHPSAEDTPGDGKARHAGDAKKQRTGEDKTRRVGDGKTHRAGDGKHVTGIFRRAAGGFGFVRPAGTAAIDGKTLDVFIPADRSGDAASGDTVLVRLGGRPDPRRTNPAGEIIEVIERETHQFVGTYFESRGGAWVHVDGTIFSAPISVGDPGAKNAQPDDKVVFEMVRFPTHQHEGEGVITEVLGARGGPGVDTLSIIREFNLPEPFASDTLDEARAEADRFDETDLGDRLDLTEATIITIDPVDARDFDDAISLEQIERGHWRLGVHIADVSHFVRPHTALDREALARATSVYLPDRVIPMLPEIISNGLASLQPDRVRYTKTVFIEFTPDGAPVASESHQAAIRSVRRFTYEEVDEYLADPGSWRSKLSPEVHALLGRMRTLAAMLRGRRMKRGALELTMPEVKIDLDRDGHVSGAHVTQNTESHQIIEEFMLAANMAVAEQLRDAKLHFLRRVHAAPDPRKLKLLAQFVAELGFPTDGLVDRFELQRLLKQVEELPQRHAVNYAVLRSLQRAVYSPEEDGHFALASDCYCHFTSPIRRYPDLTVHRLIEALLTGRKPRNDLGEMVALGEHCSQRERRAEDAERELTKVKLLNYLSTRIGQEMEAVITGVESFGLFAQGVELPAEGLIHVTSLADDTYRYDRAAHTLVGHRAGNQFRLGDPVRVVVARVDVDRRQLDFRLAERMARPAQPTKPGRGGKRHATTTRGVSQGQSHQSDAPARAGRTKGEKSPARPKSSGYKKHTSKAKAARRKGGRR